MAPVVGLGVWAVSSPVAMAYVYYCVMGLRQGVPRLVASLPLMAFYYHTGYGFGTVFERGVYSFFFIWLTSFKLALLCWDLGPVADPWAVASFPRFLAVMNLSLQIKRQQFSERFAKAAAALPRTIKPLESSPATYRSVNGTSHGGVADSRTSTSTTVHRCKGDHLKQSFDVISRNGDLIQGFEITHNGEHRRFDSSRDENGTVIDKQAGGRGCASRREVWGILALLKAVEASQEMPMVVLRLLLKFVCLGLIVYSYRYRDAMHVGVISLVYSLDIYVSCSIIFEGIAAVVSPMMGIELEAAFNKPFLAHSLADFWGRRWNLLVSNLLRVSVHDPVLRVLMQWSNPDLNLKRKSAVGRQDQHCQDESKSETVSKSAPPKLPLWPRSVAAFACFLASGLMHELIFYNMTRSKPTWQVTFFFVLNGAATVLEGALRHMTTLRLPKLFSIPLTVSFVLVTAIWYFYPPLVDSGAVDDSIAEFTYFFQRLHDLVAGS